MKVKTKDGEVELTDEMVCRGMVFEADGGANRMTIGDGSHDEVAQRAAIGLCERLLGCDPTLASRADCERFGACWLPPRRDLPVAASDTKEAERDGACFIGVKVKTRDGEVELTPEMVCRGMVFQWQSRTIVLRYRENGFWHSATDTQWTAAFLAESATLLGCDPTIASRADCERFGVHGDAAAHGFARARDGGALDLERDAPEGAVYEHVSGGARRVTGAAVPFTDKMRFVGLDTRYASPDNVKRLCCYEPDASERRDGLSALPRWQDVAWRKAPRRRCTLAIGDHAEHEDIATGVKWHRQAERMSDAYLKSRAEEWLRSGAKPLQCRKTPEEMADWNRHAEEAERLRGNAAPRCGVIHPNYPCTSCSLASGEHDYHEDESTGAVWPYDAVVQPKGTTVRDDDVCPSCNVVRSMGHAPGCRVGAFQSETAPSSAGAAQEASAVTRADVALAPCGHPVVTMVDDSGEHTFHLTEAIAEGLARSIGDVLQFPWTNRESVSQRCPRHPHLLILCGCTCTACAQESEAESLPDLCLDFAIKAKDYLRTRDPALAEEARSLHARTLAIMPGSDARRESLDTLLRMMAEAPSREGEER